MATAVSGADVMITSAFDTLAMLVFILCMSENDGKWCKLAAKDSKHLLKSRVSVEQKVGRWEGSSHLPTFCSLATISRLLLGEMRASVIPIRSVVPVCIKTVSERTANTVLFEECFTIPLGRTKHCCLEELIRTYDGDDQKAFASTIEVGVCGGTACEPDSIGFPLKRASLCSFGCDKVPAADLGS